MNHVAIIIVTAHAISEYNRASIGDVCAHLASPELNGIMNGANKKPQMIMNNPDLQRILHVASKPEIIPDINKSTFQNIPYNEAL
jgi:hypothetical protein